MSFGEQLKRWRTAKNFTQKVLAEEIGVDESTYRRWENGSQTPRSDFRRAIRAALGLTVNQINEMLGLEPDLNNGYKARTFGSFADGGSLKDLMENLHGIEETEFPYPASQDGEYGNDEDWLAIYQDSPSTGYVITTADDDVIAFWYMIAIKSAVYENGVRGNNINRALRVNHIDDLIEPRHYHAYFVSLFVRPQHENPATHKLIRDSVLAMLREYAENGIFFARVFGNMSSMRAVRLATRSGFKEVCDHAEHLMWDENRNIVPTKVCELNMFAHKTPRLLEHDPHLAVLYRQARSK